MNKTDLLNMCPTLYKQTHTEEECVDFMQQLLNGAHSRKSLGFFQTLCMYFHVPYVNPLCVNHGEERHAVNIDGTEVIYGCESMGVFVGSLLTGLMLQSETNAEILNTIKKSFMFTSAGILMGINPELFDSVKRYIGSNYPDLADLLPEREQSVWNPQLLCWEDQKATALLASLCRFANVPETADSITLCAAQAKDTHEASLGHVHILYDIYTMGKFIAALMDGVADGTESAATLASALRTFTFDAAALREHFAATDDTALEKRLSLALEKTKSAEAARLVKEVYRFRHKVAWDAESLRYEVQRGDG